MANAGDFFAQLAGAIGRAAYGGPKLNPNYGKPTDDITIDDEGNWYQKGKAVSQEDAQLADSNRYRTPGFGERFWSPDVAATEEAGNRAQAEALAKQDIARTVQSKTFAGLNDPNRNNVLANAALLSGGTNASTTGGIDPNAIARGVSNYGSNIAGTQSAGDIAAATAGKTTAEIARDIANRTAGSQVNTGVSKALEAATLAAGANRLAPVQVSSAEQDLVNKLGAGSSTATPNPNVNVSYSLDANGNVIRKLVPSIGMSFKDRLLYGAMPELGGGPRMLRNKVTGEVMPTRGDIVATVPGMSTASVARPASYTASLVESLGLGNGGSAYDLPMTGVTPKTERKALSVKPTVSDVQAQLASKDPSRLTPQEKRTLAEEKRKLAEEIAGNVSYPAISIETLKTQPIPLPSGNGVIFADENGNIKFNSYAETKQGKTRKYKVLTKEDQAWIDRVETLLKKEDVARKAVANPQ